MSCLLAEVLVHELTHALEAIHQPQHFRLNGRHGANEPFFEDHRTAEVGHALESLIWGGSMESWGTGSDGDDNDLNTKRGLNIHKWLDLFDISLLTPRGYSNMARRRARPWITRYAVPMDWIQKLFINEFWGQELKSSGPTALRVPKVFGIREMSNEWVQGDEDSWSDGDSSVGRHEDNDWVVIPDQEPRLFAKYPIDDELLDVSYPHVAPTDPQWLRGVARYIKMLGHNAWPEHHEQRKHGRRRTY